MNQETLQRIAAGCLFACLLVSSPSIAQVPSIGVFADHGGNLCNIEDAGPGLLSVYVVVMAPAGIKTVQFAAPMPACMAGVTYLSDTIVFPSTTGDSQSGVRIDFGDCLEFDHVLTINYFGEGASTACCEYPVIGDPNLPSGEIEMTNCDDEIVFGDGHTAIVNGDGSCPCNYAFFGPAKPKPEDESVDVSLSPILNWIFFMNPPVDDVTYDVFFGTNTEPPLVAANHPDSTFAPGVLSTETDYYWKVVAHPSIGGSIAGPVWSFTTTSELAVERSTWGLIKQLYR